MLYRQLVTQLKTRRINLRISAQELAQKIGVADSLITAWESQKKIPNASNFINWANALECELALHQFKTPPDNWKPSDELINYLMTNYGSEVDLKYEEEQFVDYYKSNGVLKADWDACFRNWIRRSIQFANTRRQTKTFNSPYDSNAVQERRKRISDVASMGDKVSDGQRQNIRTIKYDR
jgi:transcriptional regulator with XRE-family HTH domain